MSKRKAKRRNNVKKKSQKAQKCQKRKEKPKNLRIKEARRRDGKDAAIHLEPQAPEGNPGELAVEKEVGELELDDDVGQVEQFADVIFN